MIVVFTLLMVIAAAGVNIVMPEVYSVSTMLEPGKETENKSFVAS